MKIFLIVLYFILFLFISDTFSRTIYIYKYESDKTQWQNLLVKVQDNEWDEFISEGSESPDKAQITIDKENNLYFLTSSIYNAQVLKFSNCQKTIIDKIIFPDKGSSFNFFTDGKSIPYMVYGNSDGQQKHFIKIEKYIGTNWQLYDEYLYDGYTSLKNTFHQLNSKGDLIAAIDYFGKLKVNSGNNGEQVLLARLKLNKSTNMAHYTCTGKEWDNSLYNIYLSDMKLDNMDTPYLIFGVYSKTAEQQLYCFKNSKFERMLLPADLKKCKEPLLYFDKENNLYIFAINSSEKIQITKYSQGKWQSIYLPKIFIPQTVKFRLSIAIGPDGSMYLAYADWLRSYHNKVVVLKFKDNIWSLIGQREYDYNITGVDLVVNNQDIPFLALTMWR